MCLIAIDRLYRSSRLQHHQFCASGDLVAFAAEEAGYHTVLRGGDLLLHLHRFEDEQCGAGFDMLAGLHEDADDLPSHGSVQVTSASGSRPSTLAGVKEAIFSPLKLERNLSSFFVECRVVQESLGQLEDVLSHCDPVAPWRSGTGTMSTSITWSSVALRRYANFTPALRYASHHSAARG